MAICGFRADNYSFGLLEGGVLQQILSLLEKAREGLPLKDAGQDEAKWIEAFERSGLLTLRDEKSFLEPEGIRLLETCRNLLNVEVEASRP